MKKIKFDSELIKIIVSSILFLIAMLLNQYKAVYIILLILAYANVSYKTYFHAFHDLKNKDFFNESILMIIATVGAFCIKEYPEAVIVMILYQFGEYLSDITIDNSMDAISKLLDLGSETIHILKDGKVSTVDVKKAKVGDLFIVKQGEKIPLDGTIIEGYSNVNTSSLTGESAPRVVKPSYKVLSGTINLTNIITVKATSTYDTTTTTKIIDLMANSPNKKANMEKFITKFSRIYTPVVVVLAILLTIIPTVFFNQDLNVWIYRSLELLVISCPCALVISIPLSFFCGIGRASKEGILIKGNKELDYLNSINALVLDKTGTITKGVFSVTKVNSINTISNTKVLELAAHMEFYSNHPIAKSIISKYGSMINEYRVKDYKEIPGMGVTCTIDGEQYYLGNADLLSKHKISPLDHGDDFGTIIYLADKKKCLGYIVISDIIKKEAYVLKSNLNTLGINKIVMLSGDDEEIVGKVANEINIREYYGNLLPLDKINKLKELKGKYHCAFVGDGVNDAPALKLADIGVSMGGIGSDVAIESSDIVLMKDDLNGIIKSLVIAKMTRRIIIFNIVFALLFKTLVMVLSILGITSMWMAIFADVGVTLLTVLNSIRIFNKHI